MSDFLEITEQQFKRARQQQDLTAMRQLVDQAHDILDDDPRVALLEYQYYQTLGHWPACLDTLREVRHNSAGNANLLLAEASCLERMLEPEAALEVLDQVPADQQGRYALIRASCLEQLGRGDEVFAEMGENGRFHVPSTQYGAAWLKLCARLLDRQGGYARAFELARLGNQLSRRLASHTPGRGVYKARVIAMNKLLGSNPPPINREPVDEFPDPVFLVGFPRSGTTLLEQALDAHPGIQALEEPPTVEQAFNTYFREVLRDVPGHKKAVAQDSGFWEPVLRDMMAGDPELQRRARQRYREIAQLCGHDMDGSSVLVDKLPLNSAYLPLLASLFPNSRFIIALRHPCDSVLSAWMQHFNPNDAMAHFLSLETGALLYGEIIRILEQATQLEALNGRCHWVFYEDTVADFRDTLGGVLGFLGQPWDDAVLDHAAHARSRGTLNTPSYAAVGQAVNSRAVNRWRHYRDWMSHAPALLRDPCRSLHYDRE